MYFGRDRNRHFKILINEQEIAKVELDGSKGDDFFTVDYAIPESILQQSAGILTVKFVAVGGVETAGIYEVRLLKK